MIEKRTNEQSWAFLFPLIAAAVLTMFVLLIQQAYACYPDTFGNPVLSWIATVAMITGDFTFSLVVIAAVTLSQYRDRTTSRVIVTIMGIMLISAAMFLFMGDDSSIIRQAIVYLLTYGSLYLGILTLAVIVIVCLVLYYVTVGLPE